MVLYRDRRQLRMYSGSTEYCLGAARRRLLRVVTSPGWTRQRCRGGRRVGDGNRRGNRRSDHFLAAHRDSLFRSRDNGFLTSRKPMEDSTAASESRAVRE